jgi:hypothetical protein
VRSHTGKVANADWFDDDNDGNIMKKIEIKMIAAAPISRKP